MQKDKMGMTPPPPLPGRTGQEGLQRQMGSTTKLERGLHPTMVGDGVVVRMLRNVNEKLSCYLVGLRLSSSEIRNQTNSV